MTRVPPPLFLISAFALAACASEAGGETTLVGKSPQLSAENLKRDTQVLSSDVFGGRAPMTDGEQKTIAYISEAFAAAGLQPGNGDAWFQEVPLVEVGVDESAADISFVNDGKPLFIGKYGIEQVIWTKRIEPEVNMADAELVFVGYGVNAPEKAWNDYEGIDMAGKVAVILVNDPDWETEGLDGEFGGRAMTYYGRWTYKYEEAARQGAAGALIIHDTEPAAYGWSTVESSWSGPQIEMDRPDNGAGRVAVEGWMHGDLAAKLFSAADLDMAALVARAKSRDFAAVPMGVTASATLTNTIRRQQSNNVIGILPGSKRPDEYVLYTAHWDHLGRCAPGEADEICNGAFDNATGTAGLIELARAHAEAGPADRSLVFLAVTAEESGLLGSAYYAEQPVYPLAQTVGGLNMDGLNILGRTNDVVVIGAGKSELEDILTAEAEAQGRRMELESSPEKGYFYRSDHFSLAKKGVPMLYAEGGVDIVGKGGEFGEAAADDYITNRYHLPGDEYDPDWVWDGAVQDLELNYRIGRALANSQDWPNWREGDEFRAVRDQSRAGLQ
ncbi:M28 family metallopeptidase [Pacificimonas pallii]